MRVNNRMDQARKSARNKQKYQVIKFDGLWYVITPLGYFRPAVTWRLAMGSTPTVRRAVA